MLGQHRDDDIARVEQDGFLFVRRDLDEAKSSEQENSFNSQQCVTDFMHIATFRSKRIEQYAVIASHWLQHVRGVHQRAVDSLHDTALHRPQSADRLRGRSHRPRRSA